MMIVILSEMRYTSPKHNSNHTQLIMLVLLQHRVITDAALNAAAALGEGNWIFLLSEQNVPPS